MKFFCLGLFLCFYAVTAKAQLFIENNHNEPLVVAIAYYEQGNGFSGWVSKGWWTIIPNQKIQVLSNLPNGDVYFTMQTTYGKFPKFNTKESFVVHAKDAFTYRNADFDYVQKQNVGSLRIPFVKEHIDHNLFQTKHTIHLR